MNCEFNVSNEFFNISHKRIKIELKYHKKNIIGHFDIIINSIIDLDLNCIIHLCLPQKPNVSPFHVNSICPKKATRNYFIPRIVN